MIRGHLRLCANVLHLFRSSLTMLTQLFSGILALSIWHWSQRAISATKRECANEIRDQMLECTHARKLQDVVCRSIRISRPILILSSMILDLGMMSLFLHYLWTANSVFFLRLCAGLALRQLCQVVCALPKPRNMLWYHPGWPSLVVSYDVHDDFFFSGHTFTAILICDFCCMMIPGSTGMIVGGSILVIEIFALVALRAHYFMDIYAALATYFAIAYVLGAGAV